MAARSQHPCPPAIAGIAARFHVFVDAGIDYLVVQTLSPDDEETIALTTAELAPRLQSSPLG
jgi:hypothetical protein